MDDGHLVALSRPGELADRLQAYANGTSWQPASGPDRSSRGCACRSTATWPTGRQPGAAARHRRQPIVRPVQRRGHPQLPALPGVPALGGQRPGPRRPRRPTRRGRRWAAGIRPRRRLGRPRSGRGAPLLVLTHAGPDPLPPSDPAYTFATLSSLASCGLAWPSEKHGRAHDPGVSTEDPVNPLARRPSCGLTFEAAVSCLSRWWWWWWWWWATRRGTCGYWWATRRWPRALQGSALACG